MLYEIHAAAAINQEDASDGGWFSLEQYLWGEALFSKRLQCDLKNKK